MVSAAMSVRTEELDPEKRPVGNLLFLDLAGTGETRGHVYHFGRNFANWRKIDSGL
jgi:hypothetical protein